MQGKSFLIFGLISALILIGVIYSALRHKPAEITQVSETTESQLDQSLLESVKEPMETTDTPKQYSTPPVMQLTEGVDYKAVLHTSKGDITLDLFEQESPATVNNFVFLAKEGFYNGTIFHRVISDFMIQGGDPTGTGRGGPGYAFADEFNEVSLVRGSLAMANSGPNTNGSQFFIVTAEATPWLDGMHTNFGTITEGMEIVAAIEGSQTDSGDKPLEDIVITSAEIIEE